MFEGWYRALPVLMLGASLTVVAAGLPTPSPDDLQYQVKPGDSVYSVSHQLLDRPERWADVQRYNRVHLPTHLQPGTILSIPLIWLKPQPATGTVLYARGATVNGQVVTANSKVNEGDALLTQPDGTLALRLPDGSIVQLQGSSRARLEQLRLAPGGRGDNRVQLQQGRIEAHANPDKRTGSRFDVNTPLVAAGVRGTRFRVAFDEAQQHSQSEVTEGRVELQGQSGRSTQQLTAGQGSWADAQGKVAVPISLPSAPDLSQLPPLHERVQFRLEWPAVSAAQAYRVRVARDEGLNQVLLSLSATQPQTRISGLEDGQYVLAIRAVDAHGLEGPDQLHPFTLAARPEAPLPSEPRTGSKVVTGAVAFRWAEPEGVLRYRWQLASDARFQSVQQDRQVSQPQLQSELTPGQYYWRMATVVRQADGSEKQGPYGDVQQLTVRPLQLIPLQPKERNERLYFSWPGEPEQHYRVQLSEYKDFRQIKLEQMVAKPELDLARPDAGEWFLRVQAIDPDGFTTPYSPPQRFTVARRLVTSDGTPVTSGNGQPITAQ
ncbi:FecR domain-containing protein [Leeia sp.]|uniref:FecR domain-containing protein n=1 Tax=Leeia sp. TaxID=2884678 RepID=UPI0035AEBF33